MKKEGFYSSGDFAKLAHVSKKTLRYYDEHGYLRPTLINENGARFYTDNDFQKMQQIQLLKYLGFSLDDIKEMTMQGVGEKAFLNSLHWQMNLLDERMEQMKVVREILADTMQQVENEENVDWTRLMQSISVTGLENSLRQQYKNASNISARIRLHHLYAENKKGWFPWVFEQCKMTDDMRILEVGSGNGSLWLENMEKIPRNADIILSDSSEGMLRDLKKSMSGREKEFTYAVIDFQDIPYKDASMDLVIANHVLFYAENLHKVLEEIKRVLKPGGRLICSTYGAAHMCEISELAKAFDDRIVLAAENLYERFGKENGKELLEAHFSNARWEEYKDHLYVTDAEDLIEYIVSCHGNQNGYIVDRYKEFQKYIQTRVQDGFYITKEAGLFVAEK